MSANYRLSNDLKEALQMAQGLNSYVRADALYGTGGSMFGNAPSLTIGGLLLRLRRLDMLRDEMKRKQGADLDKAIELHDMVQSEWRVHYEEKMLKEANSRLDAMRSFFQECNDNPRACRGNYKPEAMRRTIVQEILIEMGELGISSKDLTSKLRDRDGKLRAYIEITPFI
ncbi:MAG: hypothetical protein ACPG7F_16260, partial [Aggregatilineales bacterium]